MNDDGPRYLKRKKPVHVTMDGLFKVIQSISNNGDAAKFLELYGQMTVPIPVDLVNGTKQHLFDQKAHLTDDFSDKIVKSPKPKPGEPPTCFPVPPKPPNSPK